MIGALLVAIAIVAAIPIALMVQGAVLSGIFGWVLKEYGEDSHDGSELIDLNR